ncbi:MAG: aldolase/citrate lyase family protein [candidate division KSB1 bacterium]|jgi:citrate lyase subunit beta/citryl-CoA lyase|nr:aldolase/citrate lyase family protein [candidate division KSB1 bacterium]
MKAVAQAGRKGSDVRSDCWVQIELRDSGGIEVNVKSKVQAMYGESIERLANEMMKACNVSHAILVIEDYGAVPFVLMARIEAALRRADADIGEGYLPEMRSWSEYESARTRFRRSRLYLPGNEPKFMLNAGLHNPDGVILDLEDSVANAEKDAAAVLVRNALCQVNFYGAERMVRINQLPRGLDDISYIAQHNAHVILIPKCESADHVVAVDDKVSDMCGSSHSVFYMPILESAKGILHAYDIATAAKNIVALTIGLEDYTADIGTQRTTEGKESLWARSMVVNAARAAGIQPIDTVFSDVSDMDGLRRSVIEARSLGFDGKGCIHPRQIDVIHDAFAPGEAEIARAKRIVLAFEEAEAKGLGVVSLGSKMIDPPVVKGALHTVDLAVATNKLKANWREDS